MKDRYDIDIQKNDIVIFNDTWNDWSFRSLERGKVIGFTNMFVKIKPFNNEVVKYRVNKEYIIKKPQYLIVDKFEEYKNKWMYLLAEFDNYKKQIIKNQDNMKRTIIGNALYNMIDLHDDLDIAIKNIKDNDDLEGLKNIINKLDGRLQTNFNIIKTDNYLGNDKDKFNEDYHEAVTVMNTDNPELDNKICDTLQSGYVYNDGKLMRAQKVIVYKYTKNDEDGK